jgi:nitrogen fixation protein FixH
MVKIKMTKQELQQEEAAKTRIAAWLLFMGSIMFLTIIAQNVAADTITFKFKSPSFSGIGTSSHYLTIENQEFNRKMSIKEEIKALQEQIERDKENTTLARFIRNLESRIYAQLSRQLVENLFGDTPSTSGTIELEGNIITYTSDGQFITLKITDPDGNITEISLPIGSFLF